LKVVVIADTHGRHQHIKLPKGDLLIHAGDISYRGKRSEVLDFLNWFKSQEHEHKVFVAGNHDFFFERENPSTIRELIPEGVIYLQDSGIEIKGFRLWGSPITPRFFNWAFNRSRGEAIRNHWKLIPEPLDLLITHGPPFGILDQVVNEQNVGCKELLERIRCIKPQVHIFGHIHESYGTTKSMGIRFINASLLNENYDLMNRPIVFELEKPP
jgi:Icc-related predicted phosphoesterase